MKVGGRKEKKGLWLGGEERLEGGNGRRVGSAINCPWEKNRGP